MPPLPFWPPAPPLLPSSRSDKQRTSFRIFWYLFKANFECSIVIPGTDEIRDRLDDKADEFTSKVGNIVNDGGEKFTSLRDRVGENVSQGIDNVRDAITGGLTFTVPALPTVSVDRDAVSSLVNNLRDEINKLEPAWISSLENGETPAVVSKWLETAIPTQYASDVRAAIREEFPTGTKADNKDDDDSKAPAMNSGLGLFLASLAAGVVGLAIAL